jgi:hypothetical protein
MMCGRFHPRVCLSFVTIGVAGSEPFSSNSAESGGETYRPKEKFLRCSPHLALAERSGHPFLEIPGLSPETLAGFRSLRRKT